MAQSDDTRAQVFSIADAAAQLVESEFGDLGVRVDHFPETDDRWTQCTDELVDDTEVPVAIQWTTARNFIFDTPRETASMIDEVASTYVGQGWEQGDDELLTAGGGRSVTFHKDGYVMMWGGETEVDPERVTSLGLKVVGPCIPAPQDIREWEPGA